MRNTIVKAVWLIFFAISGFGTVSAQKLVKFNVAGPEMITTESFKEFLVNIDTPKIVVRYSEFDYDKSRFDLNYLYYIIEKEFLKGGFSVKDRALYDEVVNRMEDPLDYELLQEKTDTELIFEIVRLQTDLDYITDSYFNNKGSKVVLYNNNKVQVKGAMVEFKLIIVEKNEFAGSYVFNYAPCSEGCPIRLRDYEVVFEDDFGDKLPQDFYSEISKEQLEEFVRRSSEQLVDHLNKIRLSGS